MLRADWFVYKLVKPNLHTTTSQILKWEKTTQIVSLHPLTTSVLLMSNLNFSAMYSTLRVSHIVFLNDVLTVIVNHVCGSGWKDPMCNQDFFPRDVPWLATVSESFLLCWHWSFHVRSDVSDMAWQAKHILPSWYF